MFHQVQEETVDNNVIMQIESIKLIENKNEMQLDNTATTCTEQEDASNQHQQEQIIDGTYDTDNLCDRIEASDTAGDDHHQNNEKFYEDAKKYWSNIPATVDGMLGGFGEISNIDIKGSRAFINALLKFKPALKKRYALDCGAGIGRITKGLLLPLFENVDIVEQDPIFAEKAKEFIGSNDKIGKIYNIGLQEFIPEPNKYDAVWCQWVLSHLTDDDLIKFFNRIKLSICKNGFLIIKENVSSSNSLELDDVDSSMTRPLKKLQELIKLANYRIVKITKQTNFPKGLFPVYIFACKPK